MMHLSILLALALVRSSWQVRISRSAAPSLGEKQFEDTLDIPAPPTKLWQYLKRSWGDMNSKVMGVYGFNMIQASAGAKAGKLAVGEFRHVKDSHTLKQGFMLQQIIELNDDKMTFSWAAEPKDMGADDMAMWAMYNSGSRYTILPQGNASRVLREEFYDLDYEKAKKAFEEKAGGFGTFLSRLMPQKTRNMVRTKIKEMQNAFKSDHAKRALWIKTVADGVAAMGN
eukprot:gnl/TRDRNA2_/TRDRNA2_176290_c8_seq5.p1 gnl/TRDRNA2_/TRDRNA2_176290_c8~~gnl/TRDRNA2_/TRDRNA2_176290_c8_seq5.p1  ORF type:complete len:227 (-),score=42.48 gnl/TRDRNA2_/TRDRNA2_176290_c8_seq5:169-849(-)